MKAKRRRKESDDDSEPSSSDVRPNVLSNLAAPCVCFC